MASRCRCAKVSLYHVPCTPLSATKRSAISDIIIAISIDSRCGCKQLLRRSGDQPFISDELCADWKPNGSGPLFSMHIVGPISSTQFVCWPASVVHGPSARRRLSAGRPITSAFNVLLVQCCIANVIRRLKIDYRSSAERAHPYKLNRWGTKVKTTVQEHRKLTEVITFIPKSPAHSQILQLP